MTAAERPRPAADRDSAAWWRALRRHEFTLQRCDGCGTLRFPARDLCARCRSEVWSWTAGCGTGRVVSWVVTHQVVHPAFADEVPSTVLYVALDDAPGLYCWGGLTGAGPDALRSGLAVRAVFTDVDDELTLVLWRPEAAQVA
ncbi:hypothetical protein CDO52_09595 [Nocardiopsis gilva YIM 90087]|uniref:DNA-binding protein n=1 Tax=Nocardiopsis gilva YIM 90087 TaxID=1235441 RepID=A0A223S4E4_9ACTN|nr:OB-fold domain-containing protein [Nocardiopsis gilva]ASU83010.1 hypothetical protein CDO52_09595 [Nocardiopsis gilva YIM 90087]